MDNMHIAAQLYTLRDFLETPDDIRKTLKKVKEIGYNSVQVSGIGPIEPEELKEILDENNLTMCVTHTPYVRLVNDTDNVIREHKLWNCDYVGLGSMPEQYRTSKEGFVRFAGEFSELGKKFLDNGLHLVYHNHNFEFQKFDGVTGLDILLNESDPDAFGFEIDTYWVQAGGANPVDWIKKVKGRMGVVHFKDMAIKDGKQLFAEIGEGNLNWPEIIKTCRETGVLWYAVEQDVCQRDPFESLGISLKYLKKYV